MGAGACSNRITHTQLSGMLQLFLSFANFYSRFIYNYSQVAAPVTRLTSPKIPFVWPPEAAAFDKLLELFTSAPVLLHSDTKLQLDVAMESSDSGVDRSSHCSL